MSVQPAPTFQDFEFPDNGPGFESGPTEPGWHDAILINIRPPQPSTLANDKGEKPLTSIFEFKHEGGEYDGYVKYVFVNVEGRGERSKLHKLHLAMFGTPVPAGALRAKSLLGGKLRLSYAPDPNDPNRMKVDNFAPRAKPRVQRQPVPAPKPAEDLFTDAADVDDDPPF